MERYSAPPEMTIDLSKNYAATLHTMTAATEFFENAG